MPNIFKGKKILITGGTGTVGREILRQMLKYEPEVVRIYSRDESKQFEMQEEFREHQNKIRYLIGNIRDLQRLKMAVEEVDIVFHTAALKHVYSCEYNPFEAVKTNILGTQNVIDAALEKEVEKVILTSSDKAVNPSNAMGVSKLMAEKLITATNFYKGQHGTIFSTVRFGNLLGSRGSVITLFKEQIKRGGPITITDGNMTRFVLSLQQAVKLCFQATALAKGGEVFVLKMQSLKIQDLTDTLISLLAPRFGYEPRKIKRECVGTKLGEKTYEELITREEESRTVEAEDLFIILPSIREFTEAKYEYEGEKLLKKGNYTSENGKHLSKKRIGEFLYEQALI